MEKIHNINAGQNQDESVYVWIKVLYLALNIGIRRDLGESEQNKKINKFYFKKNKEPMYVYRASFMKQSEVDQIRKLT